MKHIDVTSQVTRHQMLMDLAKSVKDHVDANPQDTEEPQAQDIQYNLPKHYHSSK